MNDNSQIMEFDCVVHGPECNEIFGTASDNTNNSLNVSQFI